MEWGVVISFPSMCACTPMFVGMQLTCSQNHPHFVRAQIHTHTHTLTLSGADVNLVLEMALNMDTEFFATSEDVVTEGDDADAMYFIVVGALEVLIHKGCLRVATLRQRQYFGESALLKSGEVTGDLPKRNATIKTLMFCELRLLLLDDFDRVVSKFPATLQNIANMSKKREAEAKEVERRRKLSNNSTSEEKESGGRLSRLGIRRGSASALATAFRRKSNPTLLDMTQLGILKNHMKDRENLQSKNSQSKEDSGGRREKACTVPNPPIPRESNVQNFDSTPQEGGQGRDSIAGNLKTKAGKETISGNLVT